MSTPNTVSTRSTSIRRLGLVTFRIAMIFSALRIMEDGVFEQALIFSKQKFWSDLPPQFDTQTFLQTAASLAIAPKTGEKYITAWCKGGQLVRVAQRKYEKSE